MVEAAGEKKAPVGRAIEKLGVYLWNNYIVKWEFGLLPKDYNFKVHGPYVPYRYYGKADTPLQQVKVGELPAWLARREKTVPAAFRVFGRAWHYWGHRFRYARYNNPVWYYQFFLVSALGWYLIKMERHPKDRQARYHW